MECIDNETAKLYAMYLTQDQRNPIGALRLMLGTKMVFCCEHGIRFDIHHAAHRVTLVDLVYNEGEDYFELYFYRRGRSPYPGMPGENELYRSFKSLMFDQLKEVFENFTGLTLSVPRIIFG